MTYVSATTFNTYAIDRIDRIIDGDSIFASINLGFDIQVTKPIRLFGIDTPEVRTRDTDEKRYGLLAKSQVERLCDSADSVFIRCIEEKDKYGRVLAELWVTNDGTDTCVNKWLCENHYAVPYEGQNKDLIKQQHIDNRAVVDQSSVDGTNNTTKN